MFQHTAARRRLVPDLIILGVLAPVSTHSRPKAAGQMFFNPPTNLEGFNTQPPEGGWPRTRHNASMDRVSTHSRPKAAGRRYSRLTIPQSSFNTQPPEGGWAVLKNQRFHGFSFNTQPPEGGWQTHNAVGKPATSFNTQPPEGGWINSDFCRKKQPAVSTHSRPKAAGQTWLLGCLYSESFNTQPPEGGWKSTTTAKKPRVCFNTQPPEGGWP